MKTQFLSYGGGLITGVMLVILFSASTERKVAEKHVATKPQASQEDGFHEVPLQQFFQNVANYRDKHARVVARQMRNQPSRMFVYSVPTLERFFKIIEANGRTAQLDHEQLAIRFYYAVYPDRQRVAGHDYGGLHTLYMVPNYWSEEDQSYKDIDIVKLAAHVKNGYDTTKSLVIRQFFLENRHKSDRRAGAFMLDATAVPFSGPLPSRSGSLDADQLTVINQGQLCPPNCPDNSLLRYIDANF